ncbi:MAG: hypothetical protein LBB76_11290 [Azoarcus sp.]|nr:hypothetical protein [Azoarcus sp.]
MRFFVLTIFLLFSFVTSWAQESIPTKNKLYAVIFQVTVDSAGKVEDLEIAKVIDPASGSADAVDITIPKAYVAAARNSFLKRAYSASPRQFFTYTFYDPLQPDRADIDPRTDRP